MDHTSMQQTVMDNSQDVTCDTLQPPMEGTIGTSPPDTSSLPDDMTSLSINDGDVATSPDVVPAVPTPAPTYDEVSWDTELWSMGEGDRLVFYLFHLVLMRWSLGSKALLPALTLTSWKSM